MNNLSLSERVQHAVAARDRVARTPGGFSRVAEELVAKFGIEPLAAENDLRFQVAWLDSGCQVIDVGARLAAGYAATSISENGLAEFRWPWSAFVVRCVTSDLGFDDVEIHAVAGAISVCVQRADDRSMYWSGPQARLLTAEFGEAVAADRRLFEVAAKVALGCCLALTDRESREQAQRRARARHHRTSAERFLPITRFVLGNNVRLDLSSHVREYVEVGGASPKVRTVVCGHHKWQVHGPRGGLRKRIWIEPYLQGPEDAPLVVRTHELEGQPGPNSREKGEKGSR